jgi:hypothetical protein
MSNVLHSGRHTVVTAISGVINFVDNCLDLTTNCVESRMKFRSTHEISAVQVMLMIIPCYAIEWRA